MSHSLEAVHETEHYKKWRELFAQISRVGNASTTPNASTNSIIPAYYASYPYSVRDTSLQLYSIPSMSELPSASKPDAAKSGASSSMLFTVRLRGAECSVRNVSISETSVLTLTIESVEFQNETKEKEKVGERGACKR